METLNGILNSIWALMPIAMLVGVWYTCNKVRKIEKKLEEKK